MRCADSNLLLWQFSSQCILKRSQRIAAAGDAHGLIDIGTPGERVTNRAAQACSRATKGLNLCGMIMRLVFKLDEPGLRFTIDLHGHFN